MSKKKKSAKKLSVKLEKYKRHMNNVQSLGPHLNLHLQPFKPIQKSTKYASKKSQLGSRAQCSDRRKPWESVCSNEYQIRHDMSTKLNKLVLLDLISSQSLFSAGDAAETEIGKILE